MTGVCVVPRRNNIERLVLDRATKDLDAYGGYIITPVLVSEETATLSLVRFTYLFISV